MTNPNMPKHHIDASVIVEPENTGDGRYCKRYLQKVNYNYAGTLSFPALSEIFMILASIEDFNDRYDFLEPILTIIKGKSIKFYSPRNIGKLLDKISSVENRIGHTDMEILACASEDKSNMLITLDKDMINNRNLETLLEIKIRHPKDVL